MRILAVLLVLTTTTVWADVVLSKKIMKMALEAAELSALAYEEDPPPPHVADNFGFFDTEPDQALVAQIGGLCYGAFRGTTMTWIDWQQNFDPAMQDVCREDGNNETQQECCTSRSGFYEGYWTIYKDDFENAIRDCAKMCSNVDECVVLTGHSQGGE